MNRKDFLKSLGALTAGATFLGTGETVKAAGKAMGVSVDNSLFTDPEVDFPVKGLKAGVKNGPVKVVIIGAGNRGRTYANYAKMFPDCMQIVGVSDIRESRKNAMGDRFNVPEEHRFGDWSEVFRVPKFADAVVISTPDDVHYDPCMKALEWGYDCLLEKPVAQTERECTDIAKQAHKYGRIVAVCHVLRYSPYFRAMYQALQRGMIGKVISIQHMEPIECRHMAHSYVRGNWRDSNQTTPIILAKSCHDLDILRWFVGKPCKTIVADGSLTWFKAENAPEGAPLRCTDGCPHESTCPFSAIDVYVRRKQHLGVFDLKNSRDEKEIMSKISDPSNLWGRCVYHCDNNQPDHFVSEMCSRTEPRLHSQWKRSHRSEAAVPESWVRPVLSRAMALNSPFTNSAATRRYSGTRNSLIFRSTRAQDTAVATWLSCAISWRRFHGRLLKS